VYTEQIRRIDEEARRYVKKHGYRYCVMGHTHMHEIDGFLVNCGDFVGSCWK